MHFPPPRPVPVTVPVENIFLPARLENLFTSYPVEPELKERISPVFRGLPGHRRFPSLLGRLFSTSPRHLSDEFQD